jgi:hypothetical protein
MAVVSSVAVCCIPETYGPVLQARHAKKSRKYSRPFGSEWRRKEKPSVLKSVAENLRRPITFTFTEPILLFWDIYLAFVYGVVYLCFVACKSLRVRIPSCPRTVADSFVSGTQIQLSSGISAVGIHSKQGYHTSESHAGL